MDTLPSEMLMKTLSYCNAATLIRASMACSCLREAATEVAMDRAEAMGIALDDPDEYTGVDRTAEQALSVVFKAELDGMLRGMLRGSCIELRGSAFLYFRLMERDVDWAVGEEEAMLVFDGDRVDWLHARDEYYEGDEDVVRRMNLQRHKTLWLETPRDYLAYTRHLALHPKYGRTGDPLDLYRSLFDHSSTVYDPWGGASQRVWQHEGLGGRHAFWFRCTLCFYDAVEAVARR